MLLLKLGYGRLFEIALLVAMALALLIPPMLSSISFWQEIPLTLLLRAGLWLAGLIYLPGINILRISGIDSRIPRACRLALAVNLSLAIVGLVAIAANYTVGVVPLPYFFLSLLAILTAFNWIRQSKKRTENDAGRFRLLPAHWVLLAAMAVTIIISGLVFRSHLFMIPGDAWVAATPAVEMINQRNILTFLERFEYPSMFGFILAGLAVPMGVPIFNANALLFPLSCLNVLTFYTLVMLLFKQKESFCALASVIYAFSGGLGWLLQALYFNGAKDFWTLSYITQDVYFFPLGWTAVDFSYKIMALGLAFAAFSFFAIAEVFDDVKKRIAAIIMSSTLFLFAFMVHIIPGFLAPVFLFAAIFAQNPRRGMINLIATAAIAACAFLLLDMIMEGFYTSLLMIKIPLLSSIRASQILMLAGGAGALIAIYAMAKMLKRRASLPSPSPVFAKRIKWLMAAGLASVYLAGLPYWAMQPPPDTTYLSFSYPWYLYVTRYGIVGILALIGVASVSWKESWFKISVFWGLAAISLGSLWWGDRLNAYLYPALAVLAAAGSASLWGWLSRRRIAGRSLKPAAVAIIGMTLALSFTSTLYNDYHYIVDESPPLDSLISLFTWAEEDTPINSSFLVQQGLPLFYQLERGLSTISDRHTIANDTLTIKSSALWSSQFVQFQSELPFEYVALAHPMAQHSVVSFFSTYFRQVYQSTNFSVFQIPSFSAPQQNFSIAILDEGLDLGLEDPAANYGWSDEKFTEGWTAANLSATSNGSVMHLQWNFTGVLQQLSHGQTALRLGPPGSITTQPKPFTLSDFPSLTMRYRVAPGTSSAAYGNVEMKLTLIAKQSGKPPSTVSVSLPVYTDGMFHNFSVSLSRASTPIVSATITLKNTKESNGTVIVDLDYIRFAPLTSARSPGTDAWFYMTAIPALWPEGYSLVQNISQASSAEVLVAYFNLLSQTYVSSSPIGSFVFFNWTASAPNWGDGWSEVHPGIVAGTYDGKKVIIVNGDSSTLRKGGFENTAALLHELLGLGN